MHTGEGHRPEKLGCLALKSRPLRGEREYIEGSSTSGLPRRNGWGIAILIATLAAFVVLAGSASNRNPPTTVVETALKASEFPGGADPAYRHGLRENPREIGQRRRLPLGCAIRW